MASSPVSQEVLQPTADVSERRLTREEGWDLIMSLAGSSQGMYDEYGGVEAFVKRMRTDEPLF